MAPPMISTMIPMSAIEIVNSRRVKPRQEFIFIKELVIPPNPPLEKWGVTEAWAIRGAEDIIDSPFAKVWIDSQRGDKRGRLRKIPAKPE